MSAALRTEQKDLSTDAYEGRDQKACKDRADADYDVAKADAKAIKAAQAP